MSYLDPAWLAGCYGLTGKLAALAALTARVLD